MKKALKILMLALLVVPCTLVFTACGGKNVGNSYVSKYVFDSYKKVSETSAADTWRDQKLTAHVETKNVMQTEIEYKKAATDTETTKEKMDVVVEKVSDMTIERKGQEEDAVMAVTAKVVTTTTSYEADATDKTLKTVVTKTTENVTLNVGRVGAKDTGKYYVASKVETEGTQTVNGEENKEYAGDEGAPKTVKAKQEVPVETFGQTLTQVGMVYSMFQQMPYGTLSNIAGVEQEGAEVKRVLKGNNLTVTISQENVLVEYGSGLMSADSTVKFNNYDLANYTATTRVENFDTTTLTQSTQDMTLNANFEYATNVTMLSESDLADYDGDTVDLATLYQLLTSVLGSVMG